MHFRRVCNVDMNVIGAPVQQNCNGANQDYDFPPFCIEMDPRICPHRSREPFNYTHTHRFICYCIIELFYAWTIVLRMEGIDLSNASNWPHIAISLNFIFSTK